MAGREDDSIDLDDGSFRAAESIRHYWRGQYAGLERASWLMGLSVACENSLNMMVIHAAGQVAHWANVMQQRNTEEGHVNG